MSLSNNFPTIRPTLLLDFANTKQLDPRITFTRASTATYYDGKTTAMAEQNLCLQSQDFSTNWGAGAASVTTNTTVAPDGTTTADTLTADGTANRHVLSQAPSGTAGTTRSFSVYVKAGTNNFVQLMFGADVNAYANFDVTSGAGALGTVGSAATASITSVGSGWYRCAITTSSATASADLYILIVSSGTAARYESNSLSTSIVLWGAQLEQRSSVTAYTATTTEPITNYIPVLQTAAAGVARFDNNPTTGESLGLLIEEQRTNLLTYSEQFDNAAWLKMNATVTANSVVAPNGTLTGDTLTATATSNSNVYRSNVATLTTGQTYTASRYVKAGSKAFCTLGLFALADAYFDLNSLTYSFSGTGAVSASIIDVGNGWRRISATWTWGAGTTYNIYLAMASSLTNQGGLTVGDYMYVWGAQLEAGSFPTSYIPTTSAQVTRAADAASMTGTNFSSWYNNAEGTLYADVVGTSVGSPRAFTLTDGTVNNQAWLKANNTGNAFEVYTNGAFVAQIGSGQTGKSAGALKANDFAVSVNGATVATDTSGAVGSYNKITIGANYDASSAIINGTIKKIAYYPARIQNNQLQALTS